MIEGYFRGGVVLNWAKPLDAPQVNDGAVVASTRATNVMTYQGLDPRGLDPMLRFTHVSTLGLNMRMVIQHQWLDYAPGRTATIQMNAADVLTGEMSGCIIASWTVGLVRHVAHVGTVVGDAATNLKVKRKFGLTMPRTTTGFNPAGAWAPNEIAPILGQHDVATTRMALFALVTTVGQYYSILMMRRPANEWIVGGIKVVPPIPHDNLKMQLIRVD